MSATGMRMMKRLNCPAVLICRRDTLDTAGVRSTGLLRSQRKVSYELACGSSQRSAFYAG